MNRKQADGTNRTQTADSPEASAGIRRRRLLRSVGASALASTVGAATLSAPARAAEGATTAHLRASMLDQHAAVGQRAAVGPSATAGQHPPAGQRSVSQSLPNEIEIRAETSDVRYSFTVSGQVEMSGTAGDFDEIIDGNTVEGGINVPYPEGVDDYVFSGQITSFSVATGRVQVLVNGTDVTDQLGEQDAPTQPADTAECVELRPLRYQSQTAEEFYGYDPNPDAPNPRQSNTPTGLEAPGVSRLFLYQGPDGLCLFIIHGGGEGEQGGAASFRISGLPDSGDWVVLDDSHEGTQDIFDVDGDPAVLHWAWGGGGRNDGAVFCGLGSQFRIRIDPAFNEAARRDPIDSGRIEEWQLLSGSPADPDVVDLALDQPIVLETGRC
jgi:hypothetical protein